MISTISFAFLTTTEPWTNIFSSITSLLFCFLVVFRSGLSCPCEIQRVPVGKAPHHFLGNFQQAAPLPASPTGLCTLRKGQLERKSKVNKLLCLEHWVILDSLNFNTSKFSNLGKKIQWLAFSLMPCLHPNF